MADASALPKSLDDRTEPHLRVALTRLARRTIDADIACEAASDSLCTYLSERGVRIGVIRVDGTVEFANARLRDDLDLALTSQLTDLFAQRGGRGFFDSVLTALSVGRAFCGDVEVSIGGVNAIWCCRFVLGAADRFYLLAEDVTQDRRSYAELAREKSAAAMLEEQSGVGRWRMSTSPDSLWCSQGALRILGVEDPAVLRRAANEELIHLEALALRAVAEDRVASDQMIVNRGGGEAHTVKMLAAPAFRALGESPTAEGLLIGIDAGADAAEGRAEQRRRDLALSLAQAAFWEFDAQTGEMAVSASWRTVFNDRDQLPAQTGSTSWMWSLVHPTDRAAAREVWRAHLRGDGPYRVCHRVARLDTREQWVLSVAQAVRDSIGQISRIVGYVQDVTELRSAAAGVLHTAALRPARRERRALCVEPNPRNRDALKTILRQAGWCAEAAADARMATHFAASQGCDLIILDVGCGADALDLLRAVRAGLAAPATTAATPVLLTVPSSVANEAAAFMGAGASDWLAKPFGAKQLAAALEALSREPPEQG
jgi:PAS domain S-box-containing protein